MFSSLGAYASLYISPFFDLKFRVEARFLLMVLVFFVFWPRGDILQTGDGQETKPAKRVRKNLYGGEGSTASLGKWATKIRYPNKGVRVWRETFNTVEEATRAYDREV